jgi:hypothetical protein
METTVIRVLRSVPLRLCLVGIVVSVPVGISTAWVGAAYQQMAYQNSFVRFFLGLTLAGIPAVLVSGLCLLYPLERWVIRERAAKSWGWTAARILIYVVAGVPIGLFLLLSIRLALGTYPAILESVYVVMTVTNLVVFGLLYSFLERALAEMRRREAKLRAQIEQLQIEIDESKRERAVQEITETDYFRDLQAKVKDIKEQ